MLDGLFIVSMIATGIDAIKEKLEPTVPAENWANKELYNQDLMDGVPMKQIMKNLQNGKYKQTKVYPEPHRNKDGKIIIENNDLYMHDLLKHGAVQTSKWIKQGKYNLTPEELEEEHKRIQEKFKRLYSY